MSNPNKRLRVTGGSATQNFYPSTEYFSAGLGTGGQLAPTLPPAAAGANYLPSDQPQLSPFTSYFVTMDSSQRYFGEPERPKFKLSQMLHKVIAVRLSTCMFPNTQFALDYASNNPYEAFFPTDKWTRNPYYSVPPPAVAPQKPGNIFNFNCKVCDATYSPAAASPPTAENHTPEGTPPANQQCIGIWQQYENIRREGPEGFVHRDRPNEWMIRKGTNQFVISYKAQDPAPATHAGLNYTDVPTENSNDRTYTGYGAPLAGFAQYNNAYIEPINFFSMAVPNATAANGVPNDVQITIPPGTYNGVDLATMLNTIFSADPAVDNTGVRASGWMMPPYAGATLVGPASIEWAFDRESNQLTYKNGTDTTGSFPRVNFGPTVPTKTKFDCYMRFPNDETAEIFGGFQRAPEQINNDPTGIPPRTRLRFYDTAVRDLAFLPLHPEFVAQLSGVHNYLDIRCEELQPNSKTTLINKNMRDDTVLFSLPLANSFPNYVVFSGENDNSALTFVAGGAQNAVDINEMRFHFLNGFTVGQSQMQYFDFRHADYEFTMEFICLRKGNSK